MPKKRAYSSRRLTGEGEPADPNTLDTEETSSEDRQTGAEESPVMKASRSVGETSLDGYATYLTEGGRIVPPPNAGPPIDTPPGGPAHFSSKS